MNVSDIPYLPASELAIALKGKEVSPVEATEAYLERIDGLNPQLHAYITVCADQALRDARNAENEITRGEYRGPMHGVPVALKDQLYTRGIRTTGGSPVFGDFVPEYDATVVEKLKQAGATLLGKLNMTEFATTGFSHQFDTPRNPWDLERYTGGSSSGSGAATAGFLCATSLGEDTGGSIRFPAAWCGLVGLRPTWGRVSRYGLMRGLWSMDTIGPISRTTADCAITLQAIAGPDPRDPYASRHPVPDYSAVLGSSIGQLRLGVVKEMMGSDMVEPEVRNAVSSAADVLGQLGASIEEVSIPLAAHAPTISTALRVEAPVTYRDLVKDRIREIGHDNRIAYLASSIIPAEPYYKAQKLRTLLRQEVLDTLQRVDVLLLPTAGIAAQPVVPDPTVDSKEGSNRLRWLLTTPFSLANIPALSICCGFTSQGLPIGLQLGGRPFDEETLLKVSHAYEQSTPWHTHRPAI